MGRSAAAGMCMGVPEASARGCDVDCTCCHRALRDELGTNCDQRHILCLLLLLERARGAASQWAPYINILPSSYGELGKASNAWAGSSSQHLCQLLGTAAVRALLADSCCAPHHLRADDPYWWSSKEVQLVAGTRLSKAIEQYRPGLDQLMGWVKRLEALRR